MLGKLNRYLTKFSILLMTAALIAGMAGCGPLPSEIHDWYDLDDVRDNLAGNHTLMNDLDSTTAGYTELAGPTANGGKGWEPIGTSANPFTGSFDGQGYEIRDLFINRPDEDGVALFCVIDEGGHTENIGVVNVTLTGELCVGGLVGAIGIGVTVSDSYSTGSVTGNKMVGGLLGFNGGTVSDSYSTGNVTGSEWVGGLVGDNGFESTVTDSYSTGSVTGNSSVGGLVGYSELGTVSYSYSTSSVTGNSGVGGLVGYNFFGTVTNSYSTGNVTGNSIVGGLVGWNRNGTVSDCFWDTQTSGQATSDGGTGKNTTEMKVIATFSGAGWNIIAVGGSGERNPAYTWNIVNHETYAFLSWQSV